MKLTIDQILSLNHKQVNAKVENIVISGYVTGFVKDNNDNVIGIIIGTEKVLFSNIIQLDVYD